MKRLLIIAVAALTMSGCAELLDRNKNPYENPFYAKYLNTGTFAKRGGKWQAVAWQATRLQDAKESPSPTPEPKK